MTASCPWLVPLGHATLALEAGKSSSRRCQKAKPYNFVSGVALKGRRQKVLLLPSLLSWLDKLCFTSRLFCSLSTSREASLLYFKLAFISFFFHCIHNLFFPIQPSPFHIPAHLFLPSVEILPFISLRFSPCPKKAIRLISLIYPSSASVSGSEQHFPDLFLCSLLPPEAPTRSLFMPLPRFPSHPSSLSL